jgi:flagellar protein FliO/FliZ
MRIFVAIVALAFAPVALSAADTDVIQPRASAHSGDTATGRVPAQPSWPMAVALILCAAAGGFVWYRRRAPGVTGSRTMKQLSIAESRALGNRQHLVVADYAGQKFLLGVCPGRIDLLSKLEEPETDDES